MQKIDLKGKQFGKWQVVRESNKNFYWWCECTGCGQGWEVYGGSLRSGKSTQCIKCLGTQQKGNIHGVRHGLHKSSEYNSWRSMIKRCISPQHDQYSSYGGRGITVCDRWLNSFEAFYEDMGPKSNSNQSIDRKDVNGNYCKENCVWNTIKQQNRNKRNTVYVRYGGSRVVLAELCEQLNLNRGMVYARIRRGWSVEKALTTPKLT